MAGFWRVIGHWRKNGYCYKPYQDVVYVYLIADAGLTHHYLHGACFLDEYQEIYSFCKEESIALSVDGEQLPAKAFLLLLE
jgi:hypothetical protein